MNRPFIEKMYDKIYTDPIREIVSKNEDYKELSRIRKNLQEKFHNSSADNTVRTIQEKLMDIANEQADIIAREMYLQGIADRDAMLM